MRPKYVSGSLGRTATYFGLLSTVIHLDITELHKLTCLLSWFGVPVACSDVTGKYLTGACTYVRACSFFCSYIRMYVCCENSYDQYLIV